MFEQASIDTRGMLKSPWAITASVAGQTIVLSAAILASLIHIDALPRGFSITTITVPGSPLKPAAPTAGSTSGPRTQPTRPFVFPTKRADPLDSRSQNVALSLLSPGPEGAVGTTGGVGVGDILGGLGLGTGVGHVPPPLPPVVAHPVEKAAVPVASTPVRVSMGTQAAKLTRLVKPAYPPLAVQAHISGTVRLAAIISRDGFIQNLQVVSGHPLLTTAAVDAVKQWRYQPTLLSGEPVEVITQIDVNFTLSR
jgi:protein TonB